MSEELKSCPFCGSSEGAVVGYEAYYFCMCLCCDTEGPIKATRSKAIIAWNTRAGEKA